MIKIERKSIKNKPFYYLTEQINIGSCFKKIQVYLGKNIPNNLNKYYEELQEKEINLINKNIQKKYKLNSLLPLLEYQKIEQLRVQWKYRFIKLSPYKQEIFWRKFAIQFIYESNAIEGSRLSQKEVETIINKQYVKKNIEKKEITEVQNSIKAFNFIRDDKFKLNQKSILQLHKLLTQNLNIASGYKKQEIIVNNKPTISPKEVKISMVELINKRKTTKKKKEHPLIAAIYFHQRFEFIHPFMDGNGRVGRLIFIWMLMKTNYGVILFKKTNRQAYFSALDKADNHMFKKLIWFCVRVYKKTLREAEAHFDNSFRQLPSTSSG
jgi:Fic family protein